MSSRSHDDAARWDARYSERGDAMWSGRPNGSLVVELTDHLPGRALDIGCGEGADAIWLAEQGWRVTAVDISSVAIDRARAAGAAAGVEVDWRAEDVLETPPAAASFDLVTLQYPALLRSAGEGPLHALLDSLAPGGLLLVVGHVHDPEHARKHGHDPDDYVNLDQLRELLGDGFDVEVHETRPRPSPPPGAHHVDDQVLRARRRA